VPQARPPMWPYRRFYRSPLSVPLGTSLGAPCKGAKETFEKGGRTDRWPQMTATRSRTILLIANIQLHDIIRTSYVEPTPRRQSSRGRGFLYILLVQARDPRRIPLPRLASGRPSPELPGSRGPEYTGRAWAEDRATRGRDPSADPSAKTGAGGRTPPLGIPGLAPTR
jgi:hypothetical protein